MADYAKKKNDELAALCKERGLAHTGKKADLVKRLEDHDAQSQSSAKPAAPAANEDEIDWDDEPAAVTATAAPTKPATSAPESVEKVEANDLPAAPTQKPTTDQAQPDDAAAVSTSTDNAPAQDKVEPDSYATGLAERTLAQEIEKRKARARRFGMQEDTDEMKLLERAKRFGTTDLPGLLNKALPEKQDKKRGSDNEHDGGIRKKGRDGRGGARGGRGAARPAPAKRQASDKPKASAAAGGYPKWMTDKDREAADRRKAKFAD